ncbi:uncharacterized protein LOC144437468 [Glandiceps talaboti]
MDITEDPKALDLLLHHLEDKKLESLLVYNLVRHIRDKKWDRTRVFVDDRNITNCRTVMCHGPLLGAECDDSGWYIYSEDEDKVKSMLNTVRLSERCLDGLSCSGRIIFPCLNDKFLKTVTQYMNNHGFQIDKTLAFQLYVRNLDKAIVETMQKAHTLPEGFAMGSLRVEHAKLVTSSFSLTSAIDVPMVRKMINEFPSVAIYDNNRDEPVSWSLLIQHGEPSLGYTQPAYRNRKFAQIRHAEMMSRLLDYGYKAVFLATDDDNTEMKAVFKKYPGLTPLYMMHYSYFKKVPKVPITSQL